MADAYDFQIESMKFRLATHDQAPYVRSTAPFRKEQFDSSPTVGDQSLTGWWTRGQLSFHRGAGLNYYEVLEDETVLNRFMESDGVLVFEDLGEVTLARGDSSAVATVAIGSITTLGPTNTALAWSELYSTSTWNYISSPGATPVVRGANDGTYINGLAAFNNTVYLATEGGMVERWNTTTYTDTIYSHSAAIDWIWYGKDRLWILDEDGNVYAVAANPTGTLPIALSTPVATIQRNLNGTVPLAFTDAGGAVFLCVSTNVIYAFTVDSDGSVTTLTAPIVAGILPPYEQAVCIRAHMGVLVIVTTIGVRFAAIDGTSLTIGPLVVEWDATGCIHIGVQGSKVYVNGQADDDSSTLTYIYELDLAESISNNPLIFPYRLAWKYDGGQSPAWAGAIELSNRMFFFAEGFSTSTLVYQSSNLVSSGYLTTGYHRFGTLDPKQFQKVTVRAKGTGTIEVYQVEADSTETSLGTMNAADGLGTFNFATTDPVERMALKFVLSRDGSDATAGPTLLGYQIKALPVPERQRLLKVPLTINDELTLRRGTRAGHRGKAYEDIVELEALESSQAVVTFTDHRTGETGSAYIDSLDFQGDTPASENSNGFGGIAYVTLRVLS